MSSWAYDQLAASCARFITNLNYIIENSLEKPVELSQLGPIGKALHDSVTKDQIALQLLREIVETVRQCEGCLDELLGKKDK